MLRLELVMPKVLILTLLLIFKAFQPNLTSFNFQPPHFLHLTVLADDWAQEEEPPSEPEDSGNPPDNQDSPPAPSEDDNSTSPEDPGSPNQGETNPEGGEPPREDNNPTPTSEDGQSLNDMPQEIQDLFRGTYTEPGQAEQIWAEQNDIALREAREAQQGPSQAELETQKDDTSKQLASAQNEFDQAVDKLSQDPSNPDLQAEYFAARKKVEDTQQQFDSIQSSLANSIANSTQSGALKAAEQAIQGGGSFDDVVKAALDKGGDDLRPDQRAALIGQIAKAAASSGSKVQITPEQAVEKAIEIEKANGSPANVLAGVAAIAAESAGGNVQQIATAALEGSKASGAGLTTEQQIAFAVAAANASGGSTQEKVSGTVKAVYEWAQKNGASPQEVGEALAGLQTSQAGIQNQLQALSATQTFSQAAAEAWQTWRTEHTTPTVGAIQPAAPSTSTVTPPAPVPVAPPAPATAPVTPTSESITPDAGIGVTKTVHPPINDIGADSSGKFSTQSVNTEYKNSDGQTVIMISETKGTGSGNSNDSSAVISFPANDVYGVPIPKGTTFSSYLDISNFAKSQGVTIPKNPIKL